MMATISLRSTLPITLRNKPYQLGLCRRLLVLSPCRSPATIRKKSAYKNPDALPDAL
jgi:hypothetical protein